MPFGVKAASAGFFVYAAISLAWGFTYWYLIGHPYISWPLVGLYLVVALVYVWVGRNLLQRGRRSLAIGRILGVLAVVGGLTSGGSHSLLTNHPGIRAFMLARLGIGLVITVSLFLPGVGAAFGQGKPANSPSPLGEGRVGAPYSR